MTDKWRIYEGVKTDHVLIGTDKEQANASDNQAEADDHETPDPDFQV